MNTLYSRLSEKRGDTPELKNCIENVVRHLSKTTTSLGQPGMLLGKIQSGKTMAFLGIIAKAFDEGFDIAIVLTKGTKALSAQTVSRLKKDYQDFDKEDELKIFDIMSMPQELTSFETRQKLIFVAKKQHKNLERILKLFESDQPTFSKRRVLLVDDEADLASVRFVKKKDEDDIDQGKIAQQIDNLRHIVASMAFLQVTATPYALYLQPDAYTAQGPNEYVFLPKKPAFTELLPIHSKYVGGEDYFGDFDDTNHRSFLYMEVPLDEQDVLRAIDGRQTRTEHLMTSPKVRMLRFALLNFITAVVVRHWQLKEAGERPNKKFSLIIHNDTQRKAHDYQWETVGKLLDLFAKRAETKAADLRALFDECYENLKQSVTANKGNMPSANLCFGEVCKALIGGDVMKERVNSDQQVSALLDENSELKLRTPFNIFIGGNILDRGITVPNLMGFYYGRNPKTMQADTVLQHSRMYGNRDRSDLAVTRFYTSRIVYDRLKKIHELEEMLRHAFETGAHDRGVVFIQTDAARQIMPCAPSKIKMSEVYSIKPGGRLLPVGFQSLPKYKIEKTVARIRDLLPNECVDTDRPLLVDSQLCHQILDLIQETFEIEDTAWNWDAMHTAIDYYCKASQIEGSSKKLYLLANTGRGIRRVRPSGRYADKPDDSDKDRNIQQKFAVNDPIFMLFEESGDKEKGWGGFPFWWPVFVAPSAAKPCVYANAA
jgi:hypothetical protein